MATTSIRISTETHARLRELSKRNDTTLDETILDLIRERESRAFWESAREGYRQLKEDPEEYRAYLEERDVWLDAPLTTLPDDDFSEYDDE